MDPSARSISVADKRTVTNEEVEMEESGLSELEMLSGAAMLRQPVCSESETRWRFRSRRVDWFPP